MKGLAGASVFMWIIPNHASSTPRGRQVPIDTKGPLELPKCRFINIEALPGSKLSQQVGEGFRAMLLLENPVGENGLIFEQLQLEVYTCRVYFRISFKRGQIHSSKLQGGGKCKSKGGAIPH
jgi:hypothetical protein